MAKITTISLFKNTNIGVQGTAGTVLSDIIDLQDIDPAPSTFSLSYAIASTNGTAGAGTSGSSTFEYLGSPTRDGTFRAIGTFGTQGDGAAQSGFISISSPVVVPFMKIKAVSGTSNPVVLTAELHVR
jgi:hypothetical protein